MVRRKNGMKMITLNLPIHYLEALATLVDADFYANKAEALRFAARDLIGTELPLAEERLRKRESYKR